MQLGSEEHKQLFCQRFIATHLEYEPEQIAFPKLNEVELDRLRQIPFWRIAHQTEQQAGLMVTAMAEMIDDPIFEPRSRFKVKKRTVMLD